MRWKKTYTILLDIMEELDIMEGSESYAFRLMAGYTGTAEKVSADEGEENMMMPKEKQAWLEEVFEKIKTKISEECDRMGEKIPYISHDGVYADDMAQKDIYWWTNGFWGGILWQMYYATGEEKYRKTAEKMEEKLDDAFQCIGKLCHDVGFMWLHTAVADYRITGNPRSGERGENAATILAGRYNPAGGFIRTSNGENSVGGMIIDCMMNLPILYWMSKKSGDPRFAAVAVQHADKTEKMLVREDGSCHHVARLDPDTGELLENCGGQGYENNSSWSRGQAWALYGFALSYRHTGEVRYLNTAKRIAHYFLANVAMSQYLPLCDFRAPKEPVYYDSTAGACAACGLLEIAQHVPEFEKTLYEEGAYQILRAMETAFANWNLEEDAILGMGKIAYHNCLDQESIIYGDYFFIEGIFRLLGKACFLW